MNLTSQCSSGRYNAVWEGTGREPEPLPPGDFHQHLRAGWAWPSRLLPCLQLAGLGENGGLVTCKTGAVFWGSHTEYCGQRWRTEKKERERESPQRALATRRCRPGESTSDTPQPAPPHSARGCREDARPGTKCSAAAPPSGTRRQTPGLFRRGGPSVPGLTPPWGREVKTRGKPLSDSLFGF